MRRALPLLAFSLAISAPVAAAEVVPVPAFGSVQLQGGGEVTLRPGSAQRVTLLEGNADITEVRVLPGGKLRISACNGRCPQRYRLRVLIETPTMPDVSINGGGEIVAAPGFRAEDRLSAAISGGGSVDLRSVPGDSVAAAINGGGQILVQPRRSLSAAINGGGSVRYWGDPSVSSIVNGGGTVVRGR